MKGLKFFKRTSCQRTWTIAAYHSPHSLTWRWVMSFSLFRGDEARVRPLWWHYRTNGGLHWGLRLPFLGMISWQTQQPMWFSDMWRRDRDQLDRDKYERWERRHAARTRPVVADGGISLH